MTNRRVSVAVDADVNPFVRAMGTGSAAAKAFARDLESADSRLSGFVQTGLALAPALVPIGSLAVPAVAGLAAQLGVAAGAAGVTVLAFQGVGDALGALNDYQLEPTAANLEKLNEEMGKLGPAGQEFVVFLQGLRPEMRELQNIAQEGLFPGMQDGIEELLVLTPQVQSIVGNLAGTIGDLMADAGDNLNDPRWVEFFDYMDREAQPTLTAMGETLGFVVEGLANLMMTMDPLADDFTQGMVEYAERFRDWTAGLGETDGFEDFVDYIRDNGPQAMETLAALGDSIIALIDAAAPVGAAVLPVIEALAEGLAMIARSPAGPVLIGAAAAIGTLGRSLALLSAVGLRGESGLLGKVLNVDEVKKAVPTLGEIGTVLNKAGQSADNASEKTLKARDSVRSFAREAAPAAGLVAGLAVATSGLAEEAGLANTATIGLLGAMTGKAAGVAAGGLIGAAMDFAASGEQAEQALSALDGALERGGGTVTGYARELASAQDAVDNFAGSVTGESFLGHLATSLTPGGLRNNLDILFGGFESSALGKMAEQSRLAQQEMGDLQLAASMLAVELGIVDSASEASFGDMDAAIASAAPAMDALGITVEDLIAGIQDGSFLELIGQIEQWQVHADSAAGRTEVFGSAIAGLGPDIIGTAAAADQLQSALDNLLDPALSLEATTDQWRTSLRTLRDELDAGAGFDGFTKAAMENREATRQYVEDSKARLVALAGVGTTTERDMARAVAETRREFIEAGVAADINRDVMIKRANAIGLTPKLVRTVFEQIGIGQAELDARKLKETYRGLPKDVRTALRADGIPKTMGDVNRLVERYDLTEKQRTALVTIKDLATKDVLKLLDKLGLVDRQHPEPLVTLRDNASPLLSNIFGTLFQIDGFTATSYINTVRTTTIRPGTSAVEPHASIPNASGGLFRPVVAVVPPAPQQTADGAAQEAEDRELVPA